MKISEWGKGIQKVRFGVLGSSRVALKGMLPAMQSSDFAELLMVGSRDKEKAKEVANQFGAKEWGTYEDVLRNNNIDAVYVSLPNAFHEKWSIKALNNGKHVICEKPAALSHGAGKRMVEAAKKNNVRIIEGLMFRHHPQNLKVKEWIRGGVLGELLRFDGVFSYKMPDKSSNAMSKELGGGSFNDQACYPISASRMIFGEEPEAVFSNIEFDPESGVDVRTDTMLFYPKGKIAFATSIFGSYYESSYSVLGTKAHVRMGRAYAVPRDVGTKIFLDKDDRIEEINIPPADHFRAMLDDFCEEILGGSKNKNFEGDLLAEARVMEAVKISNEEKRIVKIDELE